MATYSDRLRLELMTTGEFSGTWGDRTNVNMGTILEQAIAGLKTITMTDADKTLTTATGNAVAQGGTDYTDDEARYAILSITSSEDLTSGRNVVIPAKEKIYIVKNGTTGSQQVTIKTASGTGIVIPNGKTMVIYCDGTNTNSAIDNFPSGTTIGGSEIATTTTGQTIQNKTIESSTVDSTTIGATTASTGAFTTLTSSSTTTLDGTTIPASKTLADTDSTQTLTNKTLTSPTITSPVINQITHEGTADDFQTTIAFTDPTADRTITFPDATGTVSLSDTTYSQATSSTLGLVKIGYTEDAANRNYPVELDSGQMYVNVPWVDESTNPTYSTATATTSGLVKLGSDTTQTVAAETVSATANRTYATQLNSTGNLLVNIPWTDTTYTVGDGGLTQNNFTDALKTKLDGIETGADVTDSTNVTAAGALMDSEVTNLAQVKAFSSADYATAAQGTLADSALQDGDTVSSLTITSADINGGTIDGVTISSGADTTLDGNLVVGSNGRFLTSGGRFIFERNVGAGNLGPSLSLYMDSTGTNTPSDGDVSGRLEFHADNSASQFTDFARIEGTALDITDGTEDGELGFYVRVAGTLGGTNERLLTINGTERVFSNPSGEAQLTFSNTTATFSEPVVAEHGIKLNTGTQTTLNNYREGTWSPSFSTSSGTLSTQPTFTNAKYTRIGRQVTVTCEMAGPASHNSSLEDLRLNGLPFTCDGGTYVGSVRATRWESSKAPFVCETVASNSYMHFYHDPDNTLGAQINKGDCLQTSGSLNNSATITLTYFTT